MCSVSYTKKQPERLGGLCLQIYGKIKEIIIYEYTELDSRVQLLLTAAYALMFKVNVNIYDLES